MLDIKYILDYYDVKHIEYTTGIGIGYYYVYQNAWKYDYKFFLRSTFPERRTLISRIEWCWDG